MPNARPALERFWEKVLKIEGVDACWPWKGRSLTFYDGEKIWRAHRYSFVLHAGPIPDGMMVRRVCDDHFCMRPSHMVLQKNRHQGSQHPLAKLNEGKVIYLVRDLRAGMTPTEAAEKYGVSTTTVSNVAKGRGWRHVHRQVVVREKKLKPMKRLVEKKLTDDQVREIRRRRSEGALVVSLAGEFKVNPSFISSICHRRAYKDVE
jgi:hypothetical protein